MTKNELMRSLLDACMNNKLKFRFVLFDIWFSSKENMCHIKETFKKDFVCALKANRSVMKTESGSNDLVHYRDSRNSLSKVKCHNDLA